MRQCNNEAKKKVSLSTDFGEYEILLICYRSLAIKKKTIMEQKKLPKNEPFRFCFIAKRESL